jgi:hypothetical protein
MERSVLIERHEPIQENRDRLSYPICMIYRTLGPNAEDGFEVFSAFRYNMVTVGR